MSTSGDVPFYSIYMRRPCLLIIFFFFNDTATTEIYTLSLHDALPISESIQIEFDPNTIPYEKLLEIFWHTHNRSEEHTSELQSRLHLVCRLLLEKKKNALLDSSALIHSHQPSVVYRIIVVFHRLIVIS